MANDFERLAQRAYETYCEAVGGVAFNGDPLPTWEQQRARDDQKIPDAWVAVAQELAASVEA